MIAFQSSAVVRSSSYRSCHSPPDAPAPGGEGWGEGELCSRGRQSALIRLRYLRQKFALIRAILVKVPMRFTAISTYDNPSPPAGCPAKPQAQSSGIKLSQAESSSFQKKKDCLFFE